MKKLTKGTTAPEKASQANYRKRRRVAYKGIVNQESAKLVMTVLPFKNL